MKLKHKYDLGELVLYAVGRKIKQNRVVDIKARTTRSEYENRQVVDFNAEPSYRLESEQQFFQEHCIIQSLDEYDTQLPTQKI